MIEEVLKIPKGAFLLKSFLKEGGTKYQISKLLKSGEIERLGRGLYIGSEDYTFLSLESQFKTASELLRNHKSAICLDTALSFHNLSDKIIEEPTMLVEHSVGSKNKMYNLFRKRNPRWDVGIIYKDGYAITSVARTIVESLIHMEYTGLDGNPALRKVMSSNSNLIYEIAKVSRELGYYDRIQQKIEVFI